MLPLCVAAEKQTVKHGGGIVMLQKVGHAAQGEGNCRAGGTRCCSERKLQAVQRFLPGYDIIASRLDFSVWKRMKNLAGNLQLLIYGAFPVWRNCTVRAHICNLGASEWRKRKNGVKYPLRRSLDISAFGSRFGSNGKCAEFSIGKCPENAEKSG